jgi:long-chain acyl-CoA synthetase
MHIDFLLDRFRKHRGSDAVVYRDRTYSYGWLVDRCEQWGAVLKEDLPSGSVVALQGDYSPESIAAMLALIGARAVLVPLSSSDTELRRKRTIAEAEYVASAGGTGLHLESTGQTASHEFIESLRTVGHPGIIMFSSGTTGEPKAAVHDLTKLLPKFTVERRTLRAISFLRFDHWGGINTLLYQFSNAGLVGVPHDRTPEAICEFIEKHSIELLPTTPTFINLMMMSEAYTRFDLSSLKMVSYGTEPMPLSTLRRFHSLFPEIELKQTYGLTELGVMRTRSRDSDSLWLKVGGEDYEVKIENNILWIKARSSILGYLNAELPFDADGWYNTGDRVEQDGEWIRILGRDSDIINVGGEKVYPAEVESVLLELENVYDVTVFAKENPIMGQVVAARVKLHVDEPLVELTKRIRRFCGGRLEPFKIPAHVETTDADLMSSRFKKVRS